MNSCSWLTWSNFSTPLYPFHKAVLEGEYKEDQPSAPEKTKIEK